MVEIITVAEKDLSIVEDILLDAFRRFDSAGLLLCQREQVKREYLSKEFVPSDFYIALLDGVPAACMAVVDYNPECWIEIRKGSSLFIRILAVKRFAAGRGLSEKLISHAKSLCIDRGLAVLRLNCNSFIPKLRAVFERNGFNCVAEKKLHGKYAAALYKCDVNDTEHLYHYFEKGLPPLRSVTALPFDKAADVLRSYQAEDPYLTHPNIEWFLKRRYEMEKTVRNKFITAGGRPTGSAPVYFSLGANEGIKTWFRNAAWLKIPVKDFDLKTVSFTYGDMFAVFNKTLNTGEEWWERVYRYNDILRLIDEHGYPEDPIYDQSKVFIRRINR